MLKTGWTVILAVGLMLSTDSLAGDSDPLTADRERAARIIALGSLLHGAISWLTSNHTGHSALDMLKISGGALVARIASLVVGITGVAVAAILLAGSTWLLVTNPDTIKLLALHGALAMLASVFASATSRLPAVLLLAGCLLIPAAVLVPVPSLGDGGAPSERPPMPIGP